ncbi:MAG: hypothetical protein LPK02_03050 [Rhodobacterales bacterium]|nr:hypothetical protein [Rhodobacterales bacterium]
MTVMSPIRPPRGAASVGRLVDLDPVEAGAVLYLRLSWNNPQALGALSADFTPILGAVAAEQAAANFHQLSSLCQTHARRALCPHSLGCACLGADEACFAQMVASAAEGAREEALMMALLLVRADFAPLLAGLAQDAGLALRRMSMRAATDIHSPAAASPGRGSATLH